MLLGAARVAETPARARARAGSRPSTPAAPPEPVTRFRLSEARTGATGFPTRGREPSAPALQPTPPSPPVAEAGTPEDFTLPSPNRPRTRHAERPGRPAPFPKGGREAAEREDLERLADRMERILAEEARRHGIDV